MEDHLKYTCPQRRTRCEFCNKEFTGHALEVNISFPLFHVKIVAKLVAGISKERRSSFLKIPFSIFLSEKHDYSRIFLGPVWDLSLMNSVKYSIFDKVLIETT